MIIIIAYIAEELQFFFDGNRIRFERLSPFVTRLASKQNNDFNIKLREQSHIIFRSLHNTLFVCTRPCVFKVRSIILLSL